MGLFGDLLDDFLAIFKTDPESQLKRHAKKVVNLNAQSEDRQFSAEWLAENGTPEALLALLRRFSVHYEHQTKDKNEKELVFKLLKKVGPSVLEPTKKWILHHDEFASPLRLVEHFEGDDAVVESLLAMLANENNPEITDPFKFQKRQQLLLHLSNFQHDDIVPAVEKCIKDFNEDVRFAAVEALGNQAGDAAHPILLEALVNPEEESNRLRFRIAQVLESHKWDLGEYGSKLESKPPSGWQVVDNRLVQNG